MMTLVYIVVVTKRHFTGDCEIEVVGVRKEKRDAQLLGAQVCKDLNDIYHYEGRNIRASYKIETRPLL